MKSAKEKLDLNTLYQKAQEAENTGDFAAADSYYREALSRKQNLGAWGALAWILQKKGDTKEALGAVKKMRNMALKNRSRSTLALSDCLMGRIHHDAGRKALAEKYYRESLEATPRTETFTFLGELLEDVDRGSEAKMCYQKALEVDPANYEAHFNLGLWYKTRQDYERAIKHFRQAIEINENFTEAISQLAIVMWQYGYTGINMAKELLEETLVKNIADLENHLVLAFSYKLLKKKKDAEQQFRFIVERLSPNSRACIAFGHFLANDLQNPAEAEMYFKKALEIEPGSGLAHYYYGKFLLNNSRETESASFLRKAAELGLKKAETLVEDAAGVKNDV
jgi:tetratricopeptide (TPR) repeat protein